MSEAAGVTIVVPAFNAAAHLAETLDSLLAQDHPRLEIIVVDDGSTDGTAAIAAARGDRLTLLRQANRGQSAALAAGWAAAAHGVIGYLSADDRLAPGAVRRCAAALEARPDVVLVYPDYHLIDAASRRQALVSRPDYDRRLLFGDVRCLPGPGALFRREAYEAAGPWRSEYRHVPDMEFFLRLALLGDFLHLPEALADFRQHDGSITGRPVPVAWADEPLRMVDAFYSRRDLPPEIRVWRGRARANAGLLAARYHIKSGRWLTALGRSAFAALDCPPVAVQRMRPAGLVRFVRRALAGRRA